MDAVAGRWIGWEPRGDQADNPASTEGNVEEHEFPELVS